MQMVSRQCNLAYLSLHNLLLEGAGIVDRHNNTPARTQTERERETRIPWYAVIHRLLRYFCIMKPDSIVNNSQGCVGFGRVKDAIERQHVC